MTDIEAARRRAYSAARKQWPETMPLDNVLRQVECAERVVVRRMLSRLFQDGEVGFWREVEEEIGKP